VIAPTAMRYPLRQGVDVVPAWDISTWLQMPR